MTLWIDVEDLFIYARLHARPTGIQRLAFEVYRALVEMPIDVGFVRHKRSEAGFYVVDWTDVVAINDWIATSPLPLTAAPNRELLRTGVFRTLALRLPPELHRPLAEAARAQMLVFRLAAEVVRKLLTRPGVVPSSPTEPSAPFLGSDLHHAAKPGDTICCFGAPWSPSYHDRIKRTKAAARLQFAVLVYDLIPLVRPEFQVGGQIRDFGDFMRTCLPLADCILTISETTARDVAKWAAQEGISLQSAPRPIPIGTEIDHVSPGALPAGLTPGEYVLFVSTIEARKNHLQAFRIWRRMLEEMPVERVPPLVFAGRVGWMAGDLMQAIENTNRLNGKLILIHQPEDGVLSALYRNCRFTLFTSYYEGWGLPVSESLAFGKAAIVSNRASVPEAGGDFCLYIDPDNTTAAYEIVRRAVEEPMIIKRLEARIAATHHPTRWAETAAAIVGALVVGKSNDGRTEVSHERTLMAG